MRIVRVFDIEVGQTVWMLPGGNAARYRGQGVEEGTVTKIARKYFYVRRGSSNYEEKFRRDTFESACADENSWYVLYESEERYRLDWENALMVSKIRQYFSRFGIEGMLSDDGIRTIFKAMEKDGCFEK